MVVFSSSSVVAGGANSGSPAYVCVDGIHALSWVASGLHINSTKAACANSHIWGSSKLHCTETELASHEEAFHSGNANASIVMTLSVTHVAFRC